MELSLCLEAASCTAIQELPSQHFMEPECSLLVSQEPTTGPYPDPDKSSRYHAILSLLRSILILSTHLHLGFPSGLFPSSFATNILYAFLFHPNRATYPAHLIHFDLIILIILGKITSYEGPCYAVFLTSSHFIPLRSKYSPQHPVLEHSQSMFLP
jgi:hypothetical protein